MKISTTPLLLLLLLVSWSVAIAADTGVAGVAGTTSVTVAPPVGPEPAWGRIYLRRGLAPIQYFRDRFGGPMVAREVEFHVPRRDEDRFGCVLLPPEEQDTLRAANSSMVLLLDRGVCTFEAKARLAQQMGAAALVVVSDDESVKAPVALVDKGEIEIASVMVRKSAGDMLRVVTQRERVFGRLVPIVCTRHPYACKGRTADETTYVDEQTARSGVVVARVSNETLGDFLAASYGSTFPTNVLRLPRSVAPIDGCDELDREVFAGKIALFSALDLGCSTLDKVSSAQRAGAAMALLAVGELPEAMKHPSVAASWQAYNITIAAAAVSSGTLDKLVQLQQQDERGDVEIVLAIRNRIADAWDQVRQLSVKAAWPSRKDRQEKLLQRVVGAFDLDDRQLMELKDNYLTVAGGSGTTWDQAVAPLLQATPTDHEVSDVSSEVVVDATGV